MGQKIGRRRGFRSLPCTVICRYKLIRLARSPELSSIVGRGSGIRTHTLHFLRVMPLPVGLYPRGDPCRTRTCDPLLRRQLLYPAELRSHVEGRFQPSALVLRGESIYSNLNPFNRKKVPQHGFDQLSIFLKHRTFSTNNSTITITQLPFYVVLHQASS